MSNFSDPEIVALLKKRFVPVAIDQWYERRQKDACGDFYRKIMKQGSRTDFEQTTQGKYVATADGTLLGETNHRDANRLMTMLNNSLEKFVPSESKTLRSDSVDENFSRVPPENGMVIRVHTKVLGGYEETENQFRRIFQDAVARDNLWIGEDEKLTLIEGSFPKKLAQRLARFNLVDNTRGEPPMWTKTEIKQLKIDLDAGTVRGNFHLETEDRMRGFDGELFGKVESNGKKLTRFDLVAKGQFWGEGRYTTRAPDGKFPIAMAFRLADGTDAADQVAPQGTKGWLPNYWE